MRAVIISLCIVLSTLCNAQTGIIITVCGTGTAGSTGDGGAATAAEINLPHGIAADRSGNFFINDQSNSKIRKIDVAGVITDVCGTGVTGFSGDGGPATAAELNIPYKAAIDNFGNLVVSDNHNNRIRIVNAAGIITTMAGTGGAGYSGDGGPATAAELNSPSAPAFDSANNLYFPDDLNQRVRKVDYATGIISTICGTGVVGYSGDGGPATNAKVSYPNYIYVDSAQNIFFTDNGNHCIRKINTAGIITTVAGTGVAGYNGDGISATTAKLYYPGGITMDKAGNLYIADYYNNRVRMVDLSGIIHTIAGTGIPGYTGDGGAATAAEVNYPVDLSLDKSNNVLIADYQNQRIRKIVYCNPTTIGNLYGDSLICMGAPVNFSDSSTGGTWTSKNGNATVSGTGIVTGAARGTDSILYTVYDGCSYDTLFYSVLVDSLPNSGTIIGIDSVCIDSVIAMIDVQTGGTWSSYNLGIATVSGGVVQGISTGVDTIYYSKTSNCGTTSAKKVVKVTDCSTGIGIVNLTDPAIKLVPDPAGNEVHIISGILIDHLEIMNLLGQRVYAGNYNSKNVTIDLSKYPSGLYIVRVNDNYVYKLEKL